MTEPASPTDHGEALGTWDLTALTVGAIVGADIYIASAITAGLLGPLAILTWVVAGAFATVLALILAASSRLVPRVGGPYAYVAAAFGRVPGFLAGWSMWTAEIVALPVFAIAFANYLEYFVDLTGWQRVLVKAAFLAAITWVNVIGVKAAGRINDVLTLLKLSPLVLLVLAGIVYAGLHPAEARDHFTPFAPLGWRSFPEALVLVFWAYAGFELSTVPASEVRDPARTIPRAILGGMAIVTVFYLATNLVVYGAVDWRDLSTSQTPLVLTGIAVLGGTGAWIMSAGALLSVSGSDESDMLSSARLAYAMSLDGLLPRQLSHRRGGNGSPQVALIAQGIAAFALSLYDGIASLIGFAVFNLGFMFLLTSLALIVLVRRSAPRAAWRYHLIALLGVVICLGLIAYTSRGNQLAGSAVVGIGLVYHLVVGRHEVRHEARRAFVSERATLARALHRGERFLGRSLRLVAAMLLRLRAR